MGPGTRVAHVEKLVDAFRSLCDAHARGAVVAATAMVPVQALPPAQRSKEAAAEAGATGQLPGMLMTLREAFFSPTEK